MQGELTDGVVNLDKGVEAAEGEQEAAEASSAALLRLKLVARPEKPKAQQAYLLSCIF